MFKDLISAHRLLEKLLSNFSRNLILWEARANFCKQLQEVATSFNPMRRDSVMKAIPEIN